MTIKKIELPKKENKKVRIIISIVLTILSVIILYITITGAIKTAQAFFDKNVVKFNSPIEVKLRQPYQVISKEEIKRQKELEKTAEEITNKCMEDYLKSLSPTPTQKPKSGLIKPVQAFGFTYTNYRNTPNYEVIIGKLKELYINWEYTAELIGKESSFDIGAINPSSGACGLVQALPCKKMQCSLTDIDCQLNWQKEYIANRYGTVEKALNFWLVNNWY